MSLDLVIGPLVAVTLIELMFATGLSVSLADVISTARNWSLLVRAGLVNYVAVPATAILLLFLLNADPMASAGFLILAVCPGAPYGPPLTGLAGGNTAASVGLMAVLAGSSVVVAPLLLPLLLPLTTGNANLHVDPVEMLGAILITQLIPLCGGLAVNHWRPVWAARLRKPAVAISKGLNVATLAAVLASQFPGLLEVRIVGVLGMLVLLAASLGAGWAAGGRRSEDRRAMALTTSIRNVGLGLQLTVVNFEGTPAVAAVLAYGLVQLLGSFLVALWWRRNLGGSFD